MIIKPERTIKRIIKAVGQRQSALIIGDWRKELIEGIKENQNSVSQTTDIRARSIQLFNLPDNSFTRIIADFNSPIFENAEIIFNELRRLLLPTGFIIISANTNEWFLEKIFKCFKNTVLKSTENVKKIKPKILQELVHDYDFLIDAYNGYPDGHLLMIAQIQNKEVSTLYSSDKQETLTYN